MEPFTKRNQVWLLALPLYLMLLVFRHEASHAIVAVVIDDAEVVEISLLPEVSEDEGLVRPHVRVGGSTSWPTWAAPYLGDVAVFALFLFICSRAIETWMPKWLWINLAAIGVASPPLDSAGNYAIGFVRPGSDVGRLLRELPSPVVHALFIAILAGYVAGSIHLMRRVRGAESRIAIWKTDDSPEPTSARNIDDD